MDGGEDGVRQVAQTLQSCLELTEPVQQIQLVKKVGFGRNVRYKKKFVTTRLVCVSTMSATAHYVTVVCPYCTRQGPSWRH